MAVILRRTALAACVAVAAAGQAFAADADPVAAMLALKTLPQDARWVPIVRSPTSIYYLQARLGRDSRGLFGLIYEVMDEDVELVDSVMTQALMGRTFNCGAKTVHRLGASGFNDKNERVMSMPAERTAQPVEADTADAAILETVCDSAFKPTQADEMSTDEAWEDAMSEFIGDALDDLPPPKATP